MEPLKSAYFLGGFPLVPPLQNFKKRPIWVSLPNLLYRSSACTFRAAVCAKMFSIGLKPILISRQRHLRRGDFGAPKVGLLSGRFSLGPPFAKFQKKADLGVLAQSAISQLRVHF